MDKEKIAPLAKVMKWIPIVLGAAAVLLAAVSLVFKMEDPQEKANVMLFALLALIGVGFIVFGVGVSSVLEALGNPAKKEEDGDDDLDILA